MRRSPLSASSERGEPMRREIESPRSYSMLAAECCCLWCCSGMSIVSTSVAQVGFEAVSKRIQRMVRLSGVPASQPHRQGIVAEGMNDAARGGPLGGTEHGGIGPAITAGKYVECVGIGDGTALTSERQSIAQIGLQQLCQAIGRALRLSGVPASQLNRQRVVLQRSRDAARGGALGGAEHGGVSAPVTVREQVYRAGL